MADYSKLTTDEYDEILQELVEEEPAGILLAVEGVYEALSEHFHNEVLDIWKRRQEEKES